MVFGRISRRDHGPDEKDINEYFLSHKKSSELKFVLKVAVTFYYLVTNGELLSFAENRAS